MQEEVGDRSVFYVQKNVGDRDFLMCRITINEWSTQETVASAQ